MPEISLLQPDILNGFIRRKPFPQQLLGLQLMGNRQPYPFPYWKYDILQGNYYISKPNVPNSEAHMVAQQGVGQVSGSFIYMRDKKTFEPTTLHWLREPGEYARSNAEFAVSREVGDLDDRIERFVEWSVWQMLTTGSLTVNRADAPKVSVNYGMNSTHTPVLSGGNLWSATSTADILGNVAAWKLLALTDAAMPLTTVVMQTTSFNNYVLKNSAIQGLLSPNMKEEYLKTGSIDGLLGLKWITYDLTYYDDFSTPGTTNVVNYVPSNKAIFLAEDPTAWGLWEGPSADDDAPDGHTGKFMKSWRTNDPSSRIVLEEYSFVPVLLRPDNLVVAQIA